jgi:hypothetical protein
MKLKTAEMETEGKKAETEGKKADLEMARLGWGKLHAKVTFKATLKLDELGFKTQVCNNMKVGGLVGTIQRVERPDSTETFDTVVVFEGLKANVNNMQKFLKANAKNSSFDEIGYSGFSKITILKTAPNFHRYHREHGDEQGSGDSSSGGGEVVCVPDDVSSLGTGFETGSSRGTIQTSFADAVKKRDGGKCLLCLAETNLQGAHIFPVNADRPTTFEDSGIISKYDTRNGLTLCTDCHSWFDMGYWFIRVEEVEGTTTYTAHMSEALQHYTDFNDYHLRKLPIDHTCLDAPLVSLLEGQESYFNRRRDDRTKAVLTSPFQCRTCYNRFVNSKTLATHVKRGKCKTNPYPKYNTPVKPSEVSEENEG